MDVIFRPAMIYNPMKTKTSSRYKVNYKS